MKLEDKYPNLGHFFDGYFNQDWDYDYATAADGVKDFIDRATLRIPATVTEIKALLGEFKDDKDLDNAIGDLGNEYEPNNDGRTIRQWLTNEVLPMMERHLTEHAQPVV